MRSEFSRSRSRSAWRRCALFSLVVAQTLLGQATLGMALEPVGRSAPGSKDNSADVSISTSPDAEDDGIGQAGEPPEAMEPGLAPGREDYEGSDSQHLIGHPRLESQFGYYSDSADNRALTSTTSSSVAIQNVLLAVRENSLGASGAAGREYSESLSLSLYRDASQSFGIGGGLGVVLAKPGWSDFVGSFQTSANLRDATITTDVSRDLLAALPQTIRNHVRQTDFGVRASYELVRNLTTELEFHHKRFSDDNSSDGAGLSVQRAIDLRDGRLALGYRYGCASFARESRDAYFSPNRSVSNEVFLGWSFDRARYYGSIELASGRQSIRAWDSSGVRPEDSWSRGFSGSGDLALGLKLNRGAAVEPYVSARRDVLGTAGSWNSITTGCKVVYAF